MSRKMARAGIASLVLLLIAAGLLLCNAIGRRDNRSQESERLPDITIYDADGKPFPLKSLRGSYAVLVYGCET